MNSQSMRIALTPDQTARLLEWAGRGTAAEANADIEPSGYVLQVSVLPYACWADAKRGEDLLELGSVAVDLVSDR